MSEPRVLRQDQGAVTRLTLNNPAKLNALSDQLIAELQMAFDGLKQDKSCRAIILNGAGKAFCAGHDLAEMTQKRQEEDGGTTGFHDLFDRCAKMMMTIRELPQPVIAEVHGIATAAGCQLVASADLAIAEAGARFGVNGVNIGLFCSTPMVALSRNIARKRAFEMLVTGEFISAETAKSYGLVNRVVAAESLQKESEALADKVAEKLAAAVKIGKRAFYEQVELPLDQAYAYTGDVMVENMSYRDTEEGIAAFLEKRPPDWDQAEND